MRICRGYERISKVWPDKSGDKADTTTIRMKETIMARAWHLKGAVPCHQIKLPKSRDIHIEAATTIQVQGLTKDLQRAPERSGI